MIILLVGAMGLVLWSLQLMQSAYTLHEASRIFAGALVALSAVGLVAVYLLMDGCIGYLATAPYPSVEQTSIIVQQGFGDLITH